MTDEKIGTPKPTVEKTVALLILTLSLIWKTLEQIFFGQLFHHALAFAFGTLLPIFLISILISIVFGLIRRSYSTAFNTFSVMYISLFVFFLYLDSIIFSLTSTQ